MPSAHVLIDYTWESMEQGDVTGLWSFMQCDLGTSLAQGSSISRLLTAAILTPVSLTVPSASLILIQQFLPWIEHGCIEFSVCGFFILNSLEKWNALIEADPSQLSAIPTAISVMLDTSGGDLSVRNFLLRLGDVLVTSADVVMLQWMSHNAGPVLRRHFLKKLTDLDNATAPDSSASMASILRCFVTLMPSKAEFLPHLIWTLNASGTIHQQRIQLSCLQAYIEQCTMNEEFCMCARDELLSTLKALDSDGRTVDVCFAEEDTRSILLYVHFQKRQLLGPNAESLRNPAMTLIGGQALENLLEHWTVHFSNVKLPTEIQKIASLEMLRLMTGMRIDRSDNQMRCLSLALTIYRKWTEAFAADMDAVRVCRIYLFQMLEAFLHIWPSDQYEAFFTVALDLFSPTERIQILSFAQQSIWNREIKTVRQLRQNTGRFPFSAFLTLLTLQFRQNSAKRDHSVDDHDPHINKGGMELVISMGHLCDALRQKEFSNPHNPFLPLLESALRCVITAERDPDVMVCAESIHDLWLLTCQTNTLIQCGVLSVAAESLEVNMPIWPQCMQQWMQSEIRIHPSATLFQIPPITRILRVQERLPDMARHLLQQLQLGRDAEQLENVGHHLSDMFCAACVPGRGVSGNLYHFHTPLHKTRIGNSNNL